MIGWVKEHKIFAAITSVILVLCIIITISYFKGPDLLGRTVQDAGVSVNEKVTEVTNGAKDGFKGLLGFKKIMKQNEALQDEIDRLEKEIMNLTLEQHELEELRQLQTALNYTSGDYDYDHVTADIVAADNSNFFNVVTINAGEESGISVDCVVITGNGLVGRVSEVGKGYAKVVSVVDENTEVSFQVLRDMNILGVVSGNGNGRLSGYALKADVGIVEGDILVTTGIGLYPEGIEIGKIVKVEFNSDIQLTTVTVEPGVDFKDLRKVMVLI